MDLLIEAVATLPADAWDEVRARLSAAGRHRVGKTLATARAWLIYHGLCMERYQSGGLPGHWPEPTPQLMTIACNQLAPAVAPWGAQGFDAALVHSKQRTLHESVRRGREAGI